MRRLFLFPFIALFGMALLLSCSDAPTDDGNQTTNDVAGFIVDEQAYRVPNALVELFTANNTLIATDTTSEDGEFSFNANGTPIADLRLHITHSDFKAFTSDVNSLLNGGQPSELALPMEHRDSACGKLSLLVRSDDNLNPLENVEVRLTRNGALVTKAFTDVNGRLTFDYLIAGTYGLRFAKDGYKVIEKSFTIQHCDTASFDIRMVVKEGGNEDSCCDGVLELLVKNDVTGMPIGNVTLKMWQNGRIIRDGRSGENGTIRIGDICPGTYGFDLIREGYKSKEFQLTFGCDEIKAVTMTMTPIGGSEDSCCHGNLTVTVIDKATNAPLQNVTVKLWRNGTLKETGTTNDLGIRTMDGICPGTYGLSIHREGYKVQEATITFGCSERKTIGFELEAAEQDTCCRGVLTLTVKKDGTDDPIVNSTVKLWRNGAIVETVKTNENGVAVIDGICEGKYGVSIIREGYKAKEFEITFGCSERKTQTAYLVSSIDSCCTASLKLRIIDDATESWIQGATVKIKFGETVFFTGTSDIEGWVYKEGLCSPAEYTVIVEMNGYETKTFTVRYSECKRITETIRLVTN